MIGRNECTCNKAMMDESRAGRVPGGTIVLSQEQTEWWRMIPSFQKKTNAKNAFLKVLEWYVKEWNGTNQELLEKNG